MERITIVSGAPGCGKTTLARALAQRRASGLHLVSDLFYSFFAHPVDPALPAAQAQNAVTIQAIGAAAGAFASGGYRVFLDGVFGPWFLPLLVSQLPANASVDYLILDVSRRSARERVARREGDMDRGRNTRVEHMHAAFAEDPRYAAHHVDSEGRSAAAVLHVVESALAGSDFRLERDFVLSAQ